MELSHLCSRSDKMCVTTSKKFGKTPISTRTMRTLTRSKQSISARPTRQDSEWLCAAILLVLARVKCLVSWDQTVLESQPLSI